MRDGGGLLKITKAVGKGVVAYSKVLLRNSSSGTEETCEYFEFGQTVLW
jgi:hypothetical protein